MKDSDGSECDLPVMCMREPGWAANRIQELTAERDQLLREWEDGIADDRDCMEEAMTGELRKPHKQIMAEAKARDIAAAEARGYARCQADVVAYLRSTANGTRACREWVAFDIEHGVHAERRSAS